MRSRYSLIIDEILDIYPNSRDITILDCGCGYGQVCTLLKHEDFPYVYGVDADPSKVRVCKDEGLNVTIGSITSLSVVSESVDVIVCSEVLEHLTEEGFQKVVSEFNRVLKYFGLLIITTPAEIKDIEKDPNHKRLVTFEEITKSFPDFEVRKKDIIFKNEKCKLENSGNLFVVLARRLG